MREIRNVKLGNPDKTITLSFDLDTKITPIVEGFTVTIRFPENPEIDKTYTVRRAQETDSGLEFDFDIEAVYQFRHQVTIRFEGAIIFEEFIPIGETLEGPYEFSYNDEDLPNITPHDCEGTDSKVYVNGVRVPVATVDLHLRKEGPLDVTRYVEFEFASPFQGQAYADLFRTLRPEEQIDYDYVRVDVRDYATGIYKTEFRGVATGVGTKDDTEGGKDSERIFRARAQGAGHLVANINVSKTFGESQYVKIPTVYNFIVEKLNEATNFSFAGEPFVGPQSLLTKPENSDIDESERTLTLANDGDTTAIAQQDGDIELFPAVEGKKTFQRNRDTLADVIEWFSDKIGGRTWVEPSVGELNFVMTTIPTARSHSAHYLGGDLFIESNNALSELRPINTIRVSGKAFKSGNGKNYFEAKARHEGLYERAGDRELYADTDGIVNAKTKNEVQNQARSVLKRKIDQATSGNMMTMLRGEIAPFDTIEAKPTCNSSEATDTDPLTYEIARVHHHITGTDQSKTKVNVGIHTNASEDIEIVDTWEKNA